MGDLAERAREAKRLAVERLLSRASEGQHLTAAELRLLEEAQAQERDAGEAADADSWPTRAAAAAELTTILGRTVTPTTLRDWRAKNGCPIPRRGRIPRAPIMAWLMHQKREPGRPKGERAEDPEAELRKERIGEEIRRLKAENDRRAKLVIGREAARSEIVRTIGELKRELLQDFPGDILEALGVQATAENIRVVTERLAGALNGAVDRAIAAVERMAEAS